MEYFTLAENRKNFSITVGETANGITTIGAHHLDNQKNRKSSLAACAARRNIDEQPGYC